MARTTSFSEYSKYKQKVLSDTVNILARRHLNLNRTGARAEDFIFVDAHGGLGMWRSKSGRKCLGSPVVTYKTLEAAGVPYKGFVFEKNENRCKILESHLAFSMHDVECHNTNNRNAPDIIAEAMGGNAEHIVQLNTTDPNDYETRSVEIGGLIYYDCDGHGSASEIEQLTRNNRLDVLLHFCTGKRSMYRHCAQNQTLTDGDSVRIREATQFTHNMDHQVIQNVESYHRPFWYIGDVNRKNSNKFQFCFLFGTHLPLELEAGYTDNIIVNGVGNKRHHVCLNDHLEPLYTEEGVFRQHSAFYSLEDMCYYNRATGSFRADHELKNILPFQVMTGMTPDSNLDSMPDNVRSAVAEGTFRPRVDEDCIF